MQKTVRKKKRAKSCHAKPCKNHVKIMSKSCHANMQQPCKHAKTMQKPCKHAKTMQHAARTLASTLRKNVQAVRVMQKTSCSTCHEKTARKTVRKNVQAVRVMQKTSCSTCHAKTMQKPCKNHANMQKPCNMRRVRWRLRRQARQGFYAGRGNPLNIHSPPGPCYTCYMCYISQGKPLNIHSPRVPCYMCYMCYISQGKPLNIHSPRVPCYMCYMCYMALYSTYSTDFARTEHIAHIVHIARSWGRVGVQRLGV